MSKLDFNPVPFKEISSERKMELVNIMCAGNIVLQEHYRKVNKTCKFLEFKSELFAALKESKGKFKSKEVSIHGVVFTQEDTDKILAVKNVEYEILQAYSRLIEKEARRYFKYNETSSTLQEFYDEGIISAIRAIYGFNRNNIKFSTYLVSSLRTGLISMVDQLKPFSHWTNRAKKLYYSYEDAKKKENGPISFDELVEKMKLTDNQRYSLEAMLTKVVGQSDFQMEEDANILSEIASKPCIGLDLDQREAIENANLTDWEKDVLKAFSESCGNGWKTEVAARNINQVTKKQFTRAAPAIVLNRIRKKILAQYKESTAA